MFTDGQCQKIAQLKGHKLCNHKQKQGVSLCVTSLHTTRHQDRFWTQCTAPGWQNI